MKEPRVAPLLFEALPGLARAVPWRPLAELPSPVERADAIADWIGAPLAQRVWIKRDDLVSPLYGGNKVRRYEFVLADAEAKGARRIVTAGGIASTQVMATALFGRALGLAVRVVLFDQPITRFAKQALLIDADAGAELVWGGNYVTTALRTIEGLARDRRDGNYLILPGASNPVANVGYVDAMLELAQQVERGELPRPDAIVLPTGSSGTLAALALGAAWLGWDTEIVGVRIAPWIACNRLTIGAVIAATDRFLHQHDPTRWKRQSRRARFSLHHGAIGPGYGHPTPASIEAIEQVRALTGAPGEVTYSGKALVGLRAIAREPRWRGKNLLLWNTLSTPRPTPSPDARARVPSSLRWILDAPEVA
ncbi:MAG: pyridoxal-phosphate dependent enzyme [Myxococcota bacterium]|nr:pyridoxal-phosphate dependent enzyme [Myxococcota bacterium]